MNRLVAGLPGNPVPLFSYNCKVNLFLEFSGNNADNLKDSVSVTREDVDLGCTTGFCVEIVEFSARHPTLTGKMDNRIKNFNAGN